MVALSVCVCAGGLSGLASAGETPTALEPSAGHVVDVAHIYFNFATGEKVVTLLGDGQASPADTGISQSIWSSRVSNQCEAQGFDNQFFFGLDDNSGTTALATAATVYEMGDIATDSVVDCVRINWTTDHNDVDLDSDGLGDGVVGLGGQWTWTDTDNARELDSCTYVGLICFTFENLPGDISGTTGPDDPSNTLAGYTVDVDLAGSVSSSLTFEICDTDGDDQGAAVSHTNFEGNGPIGLQDRNFDGLNDSDIDGDGLADWAWRVRFFQPGTHDFDGDGVLEGDLADSFRTIGIAFGAPDGTAIDNGDGTWTWEIDTTTSDPGTGAEDAFGMLTPPIGHNSGKYAGFFWFGGFSCNDNGGGGYTPSAMFDHQLFGPGVYDCCLPDLNCDGVIDFFDVSQFLANFAAGGDYNGDGVTDFFDVSGFLADFAAGCP